MTTDLNAAVVGDDLVGVDDIDQGFGDGDATDARHVEAVDIVPP